MRECYTHAARGGDATGERSASRPEPRRAQLRLMNEEIGPNAHALLRDHITSLELLEVLLFLRERAGQGWSAPQIAELVHVAPELVAAALDALRSRQLVTNVSAASEPLFGYAPGYPKLAAATDELARDFTERRAAVLSVMSANAIERVRSGALSTFADALLPGGRRRDG